MAKYRNSNSAKVDIDEMANALIVQMNAYMNVTQEMMTNAVKKTAKEAVKELHQAKPAGSEKYGSWDDYRAGWEAIRDSKASGKMKYDMVVHNKTHYRLAHLLEKGHIKSDGKRARAFKHIEPVEQMVEDMLYDEILHELERNV